MTVSSPQAEAPAEVRRDVLPRSSDSGMRAGSGVAWRVFFLLSRLAFAVFLLVTSAYCLLMYIPFTYFGFIQHPLLTWLPVFVRIHSYLFAGLLAAVVATLRPAFRVAETRRAVVGFVAIHGGVALYVLFRPALANMERDLFAYVWSMLCLFPLVWLAGIDLSGPAPGGESAPREWNLATTTFAAVAVAFAFALTSWWQGSEGWQGAGLRGIGVSLLFHLAIFTAAGLALVLIGVVARRTPWPAKSYAIGIGALAAAAGAGVIRSLVLPTLSFDGMQADFFSGVVALSLVLYIAGSVASWRRMAPQRREPQVRKPAWILIAGAAGLLLVAYAIPAMLRTRDWDFALQRPAVVAVWAAVLVFLRWASISLTGRVAKAATVAVLALALTGFGAYLAEAAYRPAVQEEWGGLLDSYAGADISFKTAYDILSRSVNNEAHADFYQFLKRNTNIDAPVGPADVSLVPALKPVAGVKPNIFIFVIDSWRQDYVSAYNPAVDFTPEIGKFARDSLVMQNAFTRYAGTALSEPAIWVGALQLHKQYIKPYAPMNNLQKLLDVDGYQSYISVDPILRVILWPSASITELDKERTFWEDLDLIPTLKELEAKIDAQSDKGKPIFAYSQPQNVHTLTLDRMRGGRSRREISIQEMRRMDAAFGEFIDFLKARGLYDNSIVILTSDHGDAYGEFGRYGHADFIFPEVVRIPLIIHLPPRLRRDVVFDTKQVAFSLDITPSLYSLLGHGPTVNRELFGRPLFTRTFEEQASYLRAQYLIASSYAPVYGLLNRSGKSFFIVDAVNHRNYFYDLQADPEGLHSHLTPRERDDGEREIRRQIGMIDELYRFSPSRK